MQGPHRRWLRPQHLRRRWFCLRAKTETDRICGDTARDGARGIQEKGCGQDEGDHGSKTAMVARHCIFLYLTSRGTCPPVGKAPAKISKISFCFCT